MKKIIFLVIILLIFTSGCSWNKDIETGKLEPENSSIEKLNEEYKEKIQYLTKKNDELLEGKRLFKRENDELIEKLRELQIDFGNISRKAKLQEKELISIAEDNEFSKTFFILPIYNAHINTYEREVDFYKILSKSMSLKEKLQTIGNSLSKYYYDNSPIEVIEVKEIDDKKIARINLREVKDSKRRWASLYFQGSTGGTLTSTNLVETFLQRDYDGEWIDGVKFLYEGKDVSFDHVPGLRELIYK